jgi:ParB family chromosome partitioning protein
MAQLNITEESPMVSREELVEDYTPRAFGNITLYTKMVTGVHISQVEPNRNQPRHPDRWESKPLRHSIVEAGGLFEPLLAEPSDKVTDDNKPVYVALDGHRRWTELNNILKEAKRRLDSGELTPDEYGATVERFAFVAVEVTHRTLSQEERMRVWILIHRERREWTLQEREATAKQLIDMTSVKEASRFLGITESAAEKLADIYDIAQRIQLPEDLQDRTGKDARITWAREVRNLKAQIREDDEVVDAILNRISKGMLRNSKDIRVLRDIYPEARDDILDVRKDLVRDIAQPMGVQDPVRATRQRGVSIPPDADFASSLAEMANAINGVTFDQLQQVRRSAAQRSEAKAAVERMKARLQELEELL